MYMLLKLAKFGIKHIGPDVMTMVTYNLKYTLGTKKPKVSRNGLYFDIVD